MSGPSAPQGAPAMPGGGVPEAAAGADPLALVEAWKAARPPAPDPVTLAVIEALAQRAAAMPDEATRQWLVQRIVARMEGLAAQPPAEVGPAKSPRLALAGLGELVDRLGRTPARRADPASPGRRAAPAGVRAQPAASAPVALKSVTAFRGTWSRLRAEQRLREALAQVPPMAGPLNSSQVVHRALQTMQALSPAYLDAFLAHVDGLMALEHAAGAAEPAPRSAPAAEPRRRGAATGRNKG